MVMVAPPPPPPPPPFFVPPNATKIKRIAIIVIIFVVIAATAATCWYTIDDKQQAVVTTFGKVTDVTEAGVHFKLPLGIQKVYKVDVNVFQRIELGYRTDNSTADGYTLVSDESMMITGDYNIVNVEFFVEYKVSDPKKYLFSSYEPELVLRNLVQSQIRNVVGSTGVDAVLTDGKEAVQMQVKELISKVLEQYDIGLMLTDVKIQDSEPPTEEVTYAFKAVETAKQNAETVINTSKAYENAELPAAKAQADSLIQNAEYLKQKRINEAIEQVAMFEAMYSEYALNPQITRSRMYYEAISEVLPGVKLYIDHVGRWRSEAAAHGELCNHRNINCSICEQYRGECELMKKKILTTASVIIGLLIVFCLFSSVYIVAENEYACTIRFSKIINTTQEAGLHYKIPFLENIKIFPKATMLYDIKPSEVLTSDKQNMTVDSYVLWQVDDPLLFYQTLGSLTVAEQRLDAITYNALKNIMGTVAQKDIINENDATGRNEIYDKIASNVSTIALNYGINIVDIKIKRFDLPEANEQAVYSRMISERNQIAEKYSADGEYEASIIRNNVDKQVNIIISNANAQAATLVAEGEQEYMQRLAAAYNTSDKQAFYEFSLALDALKSSLDGTDKVVILGADSPIAQALMNP